MGKHSRRTHDDITNLNSMFGSPSVPRRGYRVIEREINGRL
jgi:hypothetical protein